MAYVKMREDDFIDLLFNRVDEFGPAQKYPEQFWKEAFEFLQEAGFPTESDGCVSTPMAIVDNIAVNGNIKTKQELIEEGSIKADDDDETIEASYGVPFAGYYILNWGL